MIISDIRQELLQLNRSINDKYREIFNLSDQEFKDRLSDVGSFKKLSKLPEEKLKKFGKICAIDGSVNKKGGAYPHYLQIFRAVGLLGRDENVELARIYSPIRDGGSEREDQSTKILAQLEVEVGIKAIEEKSPSLIIMDGGLIRYKIDAGKVWEDFRAKALARGVILCGVIKDIKTKIISSAFKMDNLSYDRELLYGKLNYKDLMLIKETHSKKFYEGLSSAFLRPARDVNVIGIDILNEQKDHLEEISNLIYSLVPSSSRGVPLILDMVDRQCKVSDKFIDRICQDNLDRDIYEKFFISERDKR